MKFLFVVAFLAMVVFANAGKMNFKGAGLKVMENQRNFKTFADVAKAVVELTDEEKRKFANGVADASTGDKKCMEQLRPILVDTSVKYLKKVVNGVPMYQKDGHEFNLVGFVSHSKLFKTATSEKCVKSFMKGIAKATIWGIEKALLIAVG